MPALTIFMGHELLGRGPSMINKTEFEYIQGLSALSAASKTTSAVLQPTLVERSFRGLLYNKWNFSEGRMLAHWKYLISALKPGDVATFSMSAVRDNAETYMDARVTHTTLRLIRIVLKDGTPRRLLKSHILTVVCMRRA
jgi:hypothetical protein